MKKEITKEACVETLQEALEAQQRGADQIELCAQLDQDGLTPSAILIQECLSQLTIPVKVMVRPRSGNFIYDPLDLGAMVTDIKMMKNLGVDHIVLGLTTIDDTVDIEGLKLLQDHTKDMKITFHKAIDTCLNPVEEVQRLMSLGGIHSILSSGGADTAENGIETLKAMNQASNGDIQIIAAGRITNENIASLHKDLQLSIYHGRKIVGDLHT